MKTFSSIPLLTDTTGLVGGVVYFPLQAGSSLMSIVGFLGGAPANLTVPEIVAPPADAAGGATGAAAGGVDPAFPFASPDPDLVPPHATNPATDINTQARVMNFS